MTGITRGRAARGGDTHLLELGLGAATERGRRLSVAPRLVDVGEAGHGSGHEEAVA